MINVPRIIISDDDMNVVVRWNIRLKRGVSKDRVISADDKAWLRMVYVKLHMYDEKRFPMKAEIPEAKKQMETYLKTLKGMDPEDVIRRLLDATGTRIKITETRGVDIGERCVSYVINVLRREFKMPTTQKEVDNLMSLAMSESYKFYNEVSKKDVHDNSKFSGHIALTWITP
jgi:hypothetical protein